MADGPETLREAQAFETVKNNYLKVGLCHRCAAQAAYGHQLGFSRIHPPCAPCRPRVAALPEPAEGSDTWRRLKRGDRLPSTALLSFQGASSLTATALPATGTHPLPEPANFAHPVTSGGWGRE